MSVKTIGFCVKIGLILFVIFCGNKSHSQPAVESFESDASVENFESIGNANLSRSSNRYKFGKSSLRWKWKGDSKIGTGNFRVISHAESPLKYGDHFPSSPTLSMSIYNEDYHEQKLKITFSKGGGQQVWFEIDLTFTGWRTIWVPFFEMDGNAPQRGDQVDYDYFSMTISSQAKSGSLYIDDIVYSQFQDDRHPYPDAIVPFIKQDKKPGADHWMPLIRDMDLIQSLKLSPVDPQSVNNLNEIERRLGSHTSIDQKYKLNNSKLEKFKANFEKLGIYVVDGRILGPPLTFSQAQFYYDEKQQGKKIHNTIADFGKAMKTLAIYHDRATSEQQIQIEEMIVLGARYYLDQGWQSGSSGGTRHHIGYNMRELALAFFLMRETLEKCGLINEIGESLQWLFNLGKILGDETGFHANIDYLNTQAFYHLMLIFLTDNSEKQYALLNAYSNYISIVLALDNENGVFKVDGTGWHHNGHYPAYAIGAYRNVPQIIQTLSGTSFRIREEGHANFRKAFMATRLYSQTYDIGFGNAGRHPLGQNLSSLREPFLQMINAGTPGQPDDIDTEMAAAYLRLWGEEDLVSAQVFSLLNGVVKEDISGHYTFPYGTTAVHRRDNWAAIIKGYSKYVWASEIYVMDNRYGRYPANGTVQLYNEGGNTGSGFQQEGWDWNRYPGGTVIYLPFEELEPEAALIMYRSSETFAGAVEQDGNGVFGMILNESKGSNADGPERKIGYPGKLKARKSVFSFDDKLICIGSGISSIDNQHPTQTNLFQTAIPDRKMLIRTSEKKFSSFPMNQQIGNTSNHWVIDPYGNGYHVLSDDKIHIEKKHQTSYHNKYSVRTGKLSSAAKGVKETEGDFASGWIDHGMAPGSATYQYVIYPDLDEVEIKKFGKQLKKSSTYEILRADNEAHIVKDHITNTIGYVIFDANANIDNGKLETVSAPALVMIKEEGSQLKISAVQPDLNFPEEGGKFKNISKAVNLTITLSGRWKNASQMDEIDIKYADDQTVISIQCIHGLATIVRLVQ